METNSISSDNDALRELRDDLKDLSKSIKESTRATKKFDLSVVLLAVIQLLVALIQFVQSFAFSNNIQMIVWGSVSLIAVLLMLKHFFNKI